RSAAEAIDPSLNPEQTEPAPSDEDTIKALTSTAARLVKVSGNAAGSGADAARRLADLLSQLAKADPAARQRVEAAVVEPLRRGLEQLRSQMKAQPISIATIPPDLARQWLSPDGQARVEVLPKGDPDDTATVREFVQSVSAVEPTASGPAVVLFEA